MANNYKIQPYERHPGDKAFRKVSVSAPNVPKFEEFKSDKQVVPYNNGTVLEILHDDGTTLLVYEGNREIAQYAVSGDKVYIVNAIPLHRLWLRSIDGSGLSYKIPIQLPQDAGRWVCHVQAGGNNVELIGDKYFDMVYEIRRS